MTTNPLDKIQQSYESFTKTEQNIAAFIINNPDTFARHHIAHTVETTKSSKAAMIRFAKKLGYNGYNELKYEMSRFLISSNYDEMDEGKSNDESLVKKVTANYCRFIEKINETVDYDVVKQMAKNIINSKRVVVFAINRTSLSAHQFVMRSLKIGLNVQILDDAIMMRDMVEILNKDDYCLIFTIRDNGKNYQELTERLKDNNCKLGIVTMTPKLTYIDRFGDKIFLPPLYSAYARFIDEQALFFVFVEILLSELASELK